MNATRRLIIALLAAVVPLGVTTAGRAADAPLAVINLINLPADNSAEVYYAQDLGYFKDAGLDVRITAMTNSGAIIAARASRFSTSRRPGSTMPPRPPRRWSRRRIHRSVRPPTSPAKSWPSAAST